MAEPYLGEIRVFSFNFAPQGWAFCNGQLMAINQNQALFSLLGTTYGGNGTSNFALPNLQGRTPLGQGTGFVQGAVGGEAAHTLTVQEMPLHSHVVNAKGGAATTGNPSGAVWANGGQNNFTTTAPTSSMRAASALKSCGSRSGRHLSSDPHRFA